MVTETETALELLREELDEVTEKAETDVKELLKYDVPPEQAAKTIIRQQTSNNNQPTIGETSVENLEPDQNGLTVEVVVVTREEREVDTENGEKTIVTGTLADDTGTVSFTSWTDFPYSKDATIRIENAYSNEYRGKTQLQVSDSSSVEKIPGDELPNAEDLEEPVPVELNEIDEVLNAEVEAQIVSISNGTGLITRCPMCNKTLRNGKCSQDGEISDPKPDLRIIAILDDGKVCQRTILDREATETLTGLTLEEAKELATDAMDRSVVEHRLSEEAIHSTVHVVGTSVGGGGAFLVSEVLDVETEPKAEAEKLLNEVN